MYKTRNVTFNVPAGENYQSDSISAFSGIHITDNPLLADSSSASDMLNLYLTTENTLSTRPRLEFTKKHGLNIKQMISAWKVSEDQILYHYTDSNNTIHLDINNQTIDLNNNDIGSNKIRCFKKNDKIYILSKNGYFVIKSDNKLYNVINDEDTYIPTKEIVDISGATSSVDKANMLSNKYKKLIHWTPYNDSTNTLKDAIDVENNYYKIATFSFSGKSFDFVKTLQDGRVVIRVLESRKTDTNDAVYSFYIADVLNGKVTTIPIIENTTSGNIGVSDDGNSYAYVSNRHLMTKTLNDDAPIMNYEIPASDNVDYFLQPENVNRSVDISQFFTVSPNGLYATYPVFTDSYTDVMLIAKNDDTYNSKKLFSRVSLSQYICLSNDSLYSIWLGIELKIYNYTNSADVISLKKTIKTKDSEAEGKGWGYALKNQYYYKDNILGLYSYSKFFIYDITNDSLEVKQTSLNEQNPIYLNNMLYNTKGSSLMVQSFNSNSIAKVKDLELDECVNTGYNVWTKNKVYYYDVSTEPLLSATYYSDDTKIFTEYNAGLYETYRFFSIDTDKQPLYIEYIIKYNNSININDIVELTDTSSTKNFSIGEYGIIKVSVPSNLPNAHGVTVQLISSKTEPTLQDFDIRIQFLFLNKSTFTNQIQFYNNYWLSYENKLYNTQYNDPTYIPESNVSVIGDDTDITGFNLIGNSALCVYKRNKQYVITASEVDNLIAYSKTEMKTDKGNIPFGETILSAQKNYPLQFDDEGVYVLQIPENINTTENAAVSVSEKINGKFIGEPNKENILTHNHLYWTYVMIPSKAETKIYVWDSRNSGWYYWTIPIKVVGSWETLKTYDYVENNDGETIGIFDHEDDWIYQLDEYIGTVDGVDEYQKIEYKRSDPYDYTEKQYTETVFIDDTGCVYNFKVIDYIDTRINGVFKDRGTQFLDIIYRDDELQYLPISWKWESQIMPLTYTKYNKSYTATNYAKQLVQTGFMFVDSDRTEEYSLNFKFIPYRKKIDENRKDKPIDGTLNYIRSVVKRTRVPKFNFLKIILTDDNKYDKLNLISLKFKYKLMEEKLS